eukprot:14820379-Ditylum_brightwellii.AAC.1
MNQWFKDINIYSFAHLCVKAKVYNDSTDEEDGAIPTKKIPQKILDKIDAGELSINPWESKEQKKIVYGMVRQWKLQ